MKHLLFIFFLIVAVSANAQEKITTFILVRHAEKDLTQSTNDPDLSPEGKKRASKLADMLKETDVTAIYSTPYKRTRQTVELLATNKNISINSYVPNKEEDIDAMISAHAGGTIVVAGHSNTIPWLINKLIGNEKHKPFEDDDYENLIMVSVLEKGKVSKLVWLNF